MGPEEYMGFFTLDGDRLIRKYESETLWIEPWGRDSLRVRATHRSAMSDEDWALLQPDSCKADVEIGDTTATLTNGKITASISKGGAINFSNQKGETLLEEYWRRSSPAEGVTSSLSIAARDFTPMLSGDYQLAMRFESNPEEKIFGMGQYQHPYLDLKHCTLELAHRNSQASVPFALSSLGYGFLWNNPAIGQVVFGKNLTEWGSKSTFQLDYWVTAGDTPADIEENYAGVTGTVPMMPDYAMGFWQCKLRYRTQEELLEVAREYKRRNLPLSVIVVDFFHWEKQGEWDFDPDYWPDPKAMVDELKQMGVELMVSIWPTVDHTSRNFREMREKGYLVRSERGVGINMSFAGNTAFVDVTHPGAREFIWEKAKKNYFDKGISIFWLDEAEPEYSAAAYDFDNYRYHLGPNTQIGNVYPAMYAKGFFDGMKQAGQENIINLIRCAWAGSQRYGALAWSGDIDTTFASMRNQVKAGLNMAIAGIPWWTTDIGGFHGGAPDDPSYRECIIRWFQYGVFCPVFRLHGARLPLSGPLGTKGGGLMFSGGPNEVWSYGDQAYEIFVKYMNIRERLRPYITQLMRAAHEKGTPPMRPVFYDFPEDATAWGIEDQFMFGPDVLVAPVLYEGCASRKAYLPGGTDWMDANSGQIHAGGGWIDVDTPIESIPVFLRDGTTLTSSIFE